MNASNYQPTGLFIISFEKISSVTVTEKSSITISITYYYYPTPRLHDNTLCTKVVYV